MSRRRVRLRTPRFGRTGYAGGFVLFLLLVVVTIVAGLPYFAAGDDGQRPPLEAQATTLTLPAGQTLASLEQGAVAKVVDGDTIDVELNGKTVRVRYFGVDTPERGDRCYREATDRNETLIGETVLLLKDQRVQDAFGRELRYVFLPDGTSVDATLVAEGFGVAWTQDGRYREQIVALETQARTDDRGCLWK
ncbi:MAG TPA: thermonuclease family protein [Dehalococcoidia bacterium]|nr:thermonuclease family protein [Dehalococcoidia bacterium]